MKLQITMDDNLAQMLDDFADNNFMSRSGLISVAVTDYLRKNEALSAVKQLQIALNTISANGLIDEEAIKQLEEFERICKFILAK